MLPSLLFFPLALSAFLPALLVVVVVLLLTGRNEPDPQRERPYAVYLFSVTFLALAVAVFAASRAAGAFVGAVLKPEPRSFTQILEQQSDASSPSSEEAPPPSVVLGVTSQPDGTDASNRWTREALQALLVGLPAVWVLWFHRGRIPGLLADAGASAPAIERLHETFLHTVCFAAVVTAMVAVPLAGWGLVRWGWPSLTSPPGAPDEGAHGLVQLAANGVLAAGALIAARVHWLDAGHGADDGVEPGEAGPTP